MSGLKYDHTEIVECIRTHGDKKTLTEVATHFGCSTFLINMILDKHELTVFKKGNAATPLTLWPGVSKPLLRVPFSDFGKRLEELQR
ncbi:hypothetical protein [Neptunomonas marina]|uniref:Uncharacterized protein n=1 Tax=Neptunomonas marina TaxID=1815562 RepID=A0A437QE81_9GAMM|nr:hypothetical protein [Neptunomonas marina]RVU32693.1 hypothetical protein EOE65_03295 [Neptunomonas marina]